MMKNGKAKETYEQLPMALTLLVCRASVSGINFWHLIDWAEVKTVEIVPTSDLYEPEYSFTIDYVGKGLEAVHIKL